MKRLLPVIAVVLTILAAAFVALAAQQMGQTLVAAAAPGERGGLRTAQEPGRAGMLATLALTETVPITVTDSAFIPQAVTITVGSQVVWTNHGSQTHRIASLPPGYRLFLPLVLRNYAGGLATGMGEPANQPAAIPQSEFSSSQFDSGLLPPGASFTYTFNLT
ncbi:MAG: cupredoxin domain-containing protein, partial [Anaerolineae bacterium]